MRKILIPFIFIISSASYGQVPYGQICPHVEEMEKMLKEKTYDFSDQVIEYTYSGIGSCYMYGYYVKKDIDKALNYFAKSAALGNTDAAHQIASYNLFQGNDKEKKNLGFKYLQKEYERGSAYSAGKLGWAYQEGLGTEKNLQKAKELYEFAAKHGMTYWQFLLAHAYEKGYLEYQVDLVKSKYWLEYEPKVHIDHYECWVSYYYNVGIYPEDNLELNKYQEKCDSLKSIK